MSSSAITISSRPGRDRLLVAVLRVLAAVAGAVAGLIVVFLVIEAWGALSAVGLRRFFTDEAWRPTAGQYNLTPMIAGTLAVTGGAVGLAAPLGLVSAVFCRFYAPPRLGRAYRGAIELLAGVPSVVYGFWGLTVLVPWIAMIEPPGTSLLAGMLVLELMILPTVALTSLAALGAVPERVIRGGAALGLSRRAVAWRIAVPAAGPGIGTGLVLAVGRAIGETMVVLMVCGNIVRVPGGLFEPVRTLTANIALEMGYATAAHRSALFVGGLVLMAVVIALVGLAELLERRGRHGG